jgi:ribosomal protein S18 acetylase RimI-like enzyme
MSRGNVRVRVADTADLPAIVALARDTAQPSVLGTIHVRRADHQLESRYEAMLQDPDRTLLLALEDNLDAAGVVGDDDRVLGMAVLSIDEVGGTVALPGLHMTNLVVGKGHRRRGVGRSLMTAAVRHAEAQGIEHIVVAVLSEDRETHRYLARLGFAPLVVRRVAPTATVRRTLGLVDSLVERRLAPRGQRRVRRSIGTARVLRRGA